MAKITCTRRIQFCAGHRIVGHESKCSHLHGHNYVCLFEATADSLDEVGRVVDFGVLKERLGGWIDEHWDHGCLVYTEDHALLDTLRALSQKHYVLPLNPTAELLAQHLLLEVAPNALRGTGITVTHVRLWETENCYADAKF